MDGTTIRRNILHRVRLFSILFSSEIPQKQEFTNWVDQVSFQILPNIFNIFITVHGMAQLLIIFNNLILIGHGIWLEKLLATAWSE